MCRSTEFGLWHPDKNTNIEIKTIPGLNQQPISKIIIDDRGYDSKLAYWKLNDTPFEFYHKPLGWYVQIGYEYKEGKSIE